LQPVSPRTAVLIQFRNECEWTKIPNFNVCLKNLLYTFKEFENVLILEPTNSFVKANKQKKQKKKKRGKTIVKEFSLRELPGGHGERGEDCFSSRS